MKIRAVVFDWAGTVVDYGCNAPPAVLHRIFADRGVDLEPAEARHAMGLLKVDQIREITRIPRVRQAWRGANGSEPGEVEVQELFRSFIPLQMDLIEEYATVIEGVPELVEKLRSAGIRIGSTTGYTRPMLDRILPAAAKQGYVPDCIVTPDAVGAGRPKPWMIFENLKMLDVYPPSACIKIGDTVSDVEEAINAGLIPWGVSDSSNEAVLEGPEHARRLLTEAGALRVLPTVASIWDALEELR
ncbi:phosphonoacetaldehyde hydrolase [Bryobacterales bacterium F-183]|nr:phosphonoacetaldehyde hydrolase [Bryobacterales bacterium F-183]